MAEQYSVEAMLSARDNGFTSTMNSAVKSLGNIDGGSQKATKSIAAIAIGMGAVQVASKVFSVMASSMDAAISRFDTMQRFPKVMETFGYSAEESTVSVNKLSDGIQGLPTKLDDVVSTAQRMTAMTGNLDKSTDATLALNNAFLASGASAMDASRGTDQYLQMLAKGDVDLQSWRTLQESMATGLQMVAKEMGFTGKAATTELYEALKSGDVTFREFQNHLIDLGTGTGTLATLARKNSEGIGTSFNNLRNAATVGLAGVIESFDNLSEEVSGKTIAQNLDGMKSAVKGTFNVINGTIKASTPVIKAAGEAIGFVADQGDILIPVLGGVAAGYGALKGILAVNKIIQANDDIMIQAALSGQKLTIATQANMTSTVAATAAKKGHTAAEIEDMTATKASVASLSAQNGVISLSSALIAVKTGAVTKQTAATALMTTMTGASSTAVKIQAAAVGLASGALSVSTVATWAMTAATTAFGTALKVIMGPIGWVVAGVGALVGGGIALFKWLNKETEASKKLNKEQSALAESTKTLADTSQNNVKRRKEELGAIETNSQAYQDLGDKVTELAGKEKLSAGEKKMLKDSVDQLNGSVAGLNLQYDEETKQLSMSTEQLKARIDAQKEQETANQAQEDLLNIMKEQHEIEAKLSETNALREEWNQKLDEGSVKAKEHREAIKGIDEQEQSLKNTQKQLQEEQKNTQTVLEEANNAIAQAVEDGTMRQVLSYESLSESQKAAVDSMKSKWQEYQDAATNMFDALSDKQEMSVGEMQANLEENQRVISTWADNIATLAKRGVDDGLLAKLRDAGPESAGYVAAMAAASDTELQKLSDTYAKGGETATTAFNTAFDTGAKGINENISAMITQTKGTLTDAIADADFKSLGNMVPKGAAEGVKSGSKDVADASGKMAKDASDAFAEEAGIHSPSRVFHEHGENVDKGAEEGIKDGGSAVVNAVTELAAKLPNEFDSLPSQMHSSGVNAMQGFADGINSGSGSALSAAQSIANQVASTINKALDIHSPSRVTKKSGQYTAEGLEIGMLDRLRNLAFTAQKMAKTVVDNMQIRSQQRFDLGFASAGLYASVDMSSVAEQPELPPIYVEATVELDGKKVSKEMGPQLAVELQRNQNKANGARGRRG
ncbi:tape measure protein [Enterococcus mediterraneensis]|uniref:tape measure protein n=1 Tax=Enterococcus mediterraneensis TaxID=2364791 RepID=UPI001F152464|nr:tape measure protein [Enterococcus mediterraneensis]